MLKDIKYFIDQDTERQEQLEVSWSHKIKENRLASLDVFKQTMPNIYQVLNSAKEYPESVFVNKEGELDIVNISTGKAFYGHDVNKSISNHLERFAANPHLVSFNSSSKVESLPQEIEVLVVFGVGLGQHLIPLLQNYEIKHLVLYEPNLGYLNCSLSSGVWSNAFDFAKKQNTAIYLQTDFDARLVMKELGELYQVCPFNRVYVYQHYHTPKFDDAIDILFESTLKNLGEVYRKPLPQRSHEDFLIPWPPLSDSEQWSSNNLSQSLFKKNIDALLRFFPDVAIEFKEYVPVKWAPLANAKREVNVFHTASGSALYGESPLADEMAAFDVFVKEPTKERLSLGSIQGKTSQFLHQKMVREIEGVFNGINSSEEILPEEIEAVLLFGIGAGYKLEKLYNCFDVNCIFICEPNRDYFFASLYAIDWDEIFTKANIENRRIYLNIGDDGSNLAKDLIGQINTIGTHVIESMYFSIGYDNQQLFPAIKKLREELKGIVALGEYFDYSRYGIAHTKWAMANGAKLLTKQKGMGIKGCLAEVPVFIVGNGPSLDKLIPMLKEERDKVIVISCGTALQALHQNNITPDFHAEIESNRDTFDWASRIGEPGFLKNISLISCNGVHPDTISLYKDVYLCLKEGEASTEITSKIIENLSLPELRFAYPTVSNFAINFALQCGFTQIYLLGVDLGFVDEEHHHSKFSGYYKDDGSELYDYVGQTNIALTVKGNFRTSVATKYEFNLSRVMIERAIADFPGVFIYNLNDGAAINGCLPLSVENVLITSSEDEKDRALSWILRKAHSPIDGIAYVDSFEQKFGSKQLVEDVRAFQILLERKIRTKKDAKLLIEQQRDFMVDSFKSNRPMFMLYYNGTVNYINAILGRVQSLDCNNFNEKLEQVLSIWKEFLNDSLQSLQYYPDDFDNISSFTRARQKVLIHQLSKERPIELFSITAPEIMTGLASKLLGESISEGPRIRFQIEFIEDISDFELRDSTSKRAVFIIDHATAKTFTLPKRNLPSGDVILICDDISEHEVSNIALNAIALLTSNSAIKIGYHKVKKPSHLNLYENYLSLSDRCKCYAYDSKHLLVISESKLTSTELVNRVGDRFAYCPRVSCCDFSN